jgi:predicted Fe-S protein YdhL (DUF1289 family)
MTHYAVYKKRDVFDKFPNSVFRSAELTRLKLWAIVQQLVMASEICTMMMDASVCSGCLRGMMAERITIPSQHWSLATPNPQTMTPSALHSKISHCCTLGKRKLTAMMRHLYNASDMCLSSVHGAHAYVHRCLAEAKPKIEMRAITGVAGADACHLS